MAGPLFGESLQSLVVLPGVALGLADRSIVAVAGHPGRPGLAHSEALISGMTATVVDMTLMLGCPTLGKWGRAWSESDIEVQLCKLWLRTRRGDTRHAHGWQCLCSQHGGQ